MADPAHADWRGRSVAELAEDRGVSPLDAFLDASLEEGLRTGWQTRMNDVGRQFIEHVVRTAVADPIVMPGSSDGGAHLASFVGADYTTRLLTDWVPDPLSLEQAIWRNTLMPATVHGLDGRGVLREGAAADLLVIDRDALAAGDSQTRCDFPADTERYVVEAEGYRNVVVNGEVLLEDSEHTGALPGEVLRLG